jgi:hypothetical protein
MVEATLTDEVGLNPAWTDKTGKAFLDSNQVGSLPVRGEKKLVPVKLETQATADNTGSEETGPIYEAISYAKTTLTDYVTIRIPSRGSDYDGYFTYRFLINPKTVQVSRQTMDAHSMTRSGWQFGVWGEDTIDLAVSGTTAGEYFQNGLTDRWEEFSLSYQNIMGLVNVFENNGYFFEGEQANTQWNAPDFMRKRIKCQGDVEFSVGNFIWSGMFTSMTMTHTADTPYFNTFEFGFLAWKERFKTNSPWIDSIHNDVYRGHDASVMMSRFPVTASPDAITANETTKDPAALTTDTMGTLPTGWSQPAPNSPLGVPLPGWSQSTLSPAPSYPMSTSLFGK